MIIDAFTFFNEKELIQLRIKYLNDIVDYFVVVEGNFTHTGKEKKWNFQDILNNELKDFSHKIKYHKMQIDLEKADREKSPNYIDKKNGRSWKVENMQRNYIKQACEEFLPDDIIIISDVDEIPSKEKISFIKSSDFKIIAPVSFDQALFHLNCKYLSLEQWVGSVVVTKELIDKYEPQVFRAYKDRISRFKDSGWSFSSFGGISRIKVKFESFAHQEYNKNEYINEEHLKKSAELGTDIFYRDVKKKKIDKNFFPKDLLKLMEEDPEFYFGPKATL
jgi:beta-1,4-mannosyl-glycoprotein beta-1,4-N-acetylglucosaminyltransferase